MHRILAVGVLSVTRYAATMQLSVTHLERKQSHFSSGGLLPSGFLNLQHRETLKLPQRGNVRKQVGREGLF